MGKVADAMDQALRARFHPTLLSVIDDSARHAGHAGATEGGESHFELTIESTAFSGLSRVARQRLVHETLAEQLRGPVHALSLKLRAPGEL